MAQSIYERYKLGFIPPNNLKQDTLWLIFDKSRLLIRFSNNIPQIPSTKDLNEYNLKVESILYLGTMDGIPCFIGQLDTYKELPNHIYFEEMRSLFGCIDDGYYLLAGRAMHINNWYQTHLFCGKCGLPSENKSDELARICPSCGTIVYPTISPAIIVAVEKDDSILLARAANFKRNMYSVIAGFLEPGETLDDCVRREVKEEVGIEVKNIKYFGSESWPYPNSLMIGFTAEYAGGNLTIDKKEINDANWYKVDNLPQIPSNISISRRLIDQFIKKYQN